MNSNWSRQVLAFFTSQSHLHPLRNGKKTQSFSNLLQSAVAIRCNKWVCTIKVAKTGARAMMWQRNDGQPRVDWCRLVGWMDLCSLWLGLPMTPNSWQTWRPTKCFGMSTCLAFCLLPALGRITTYAPAQGIEKIESESKSRWSAYMSMYFICTFMYFQVSVYLPSVQTSVTNSDKHSMRGSIASRPSFVFRVPRDI